MPKGNVFCIVSFWHKKGARDCRSWRLWRSGWDSNPRDVSIKLISSRSAPLERTGIYQNTEEATTGKNP